MYVLLFNNASPTGELVIGSLLWFAVGNCLYLLLSLFLGLICSVLFLDCRCCFMLLFNLIWRKFNPKAIKFTLILLNIVGVINNKNVFLIVTSSLISPIKAASQHKYTVNNHKLIMHMISGCWVSTCVYSFISKSLNVRSIALWLLIIWNDSYFNSSFMSFNNSVGKIIIRYIENTNGKSFLCHFNVLDNLIDISFVREE